MVGYVCVDVHMIEECTDLVLKFSWKNKSGSKTVELLALYTIALAVAVSGRIVLRSLDTHLLSTSSTFQLCLAPSQLAAVLMCGCTYAELECW